MHKVRSFDGTTVSYETRGSGPPLILVHGSFGDHKSNWEFVLPFLEKQFTVYEGMTTAPKLYAEAVTKFLLP